MARTPGRKPPDHRWRLALRLLAGAKVPRPEYMAEEAAGVLPGATAWSAADRARLVETARAAIGLRGAHDRAEHRDDVEAWLLCELAPAEVAAKTGLDTGVVAAYRDLFFDVGPWLIDEFGRGDLAWLLLGDKWYVGIDPDDAPAWKRYAALTGGPVVLGRYLDYLRALPLIVPSRVAGRSDPDLKRLQDLLLTRVWVLSNAPLKTTAQRLRMEFVLALKETQRIWPMGLR